MQKLRDGCNMNSDIFLTGMVSGATILLGVFIADWLRRLRDRVELLKRNVLDMRWYLAQTIDYLSTYILEGYGKGSSVKRAQEEREFWTMGKSADGTLKSIVYSPRWPQRNAKKIREAAIRLLVCTGAAINECEESRTLLHHEEIAEMRALYFELQKLVLSKDLLDYRNSLLAKKQREIQARKQGRD
jgi:hypothetical protein